jgi:hypothetical protein
LKLKYEELLSNFAFNFNLRRYSKARVKLIAEGGAPVPENLENVGAIGAPGPVAIAAAPRAGAYTRPPLSST